ncbi:hypothetical protein ACN47E_007759 [Coniothyrium glycines]
MAIFTYTNVAVSLITVYIARRIYWEATTGSRQRAFARKHGCLPPKHRINAIFPKWLPHLTLDWILTIQRRYRDHTLLEGWQTELRSLDTHLFQVTALGQTVFITDEPENVKAMLATGFEQWSLGQERIEQMSSYLGRGIFTNEGKAWKHSRDMLRPCFEKSAVSDTSLFDKHMKRLMALLPTDGSEVDLQPLFHEYTLDVATEFLFGRSTDSLKRAEETKDVQEFIEAFEYCTDPSSKENYKKYGYIGLFLPDGKRKRCIKTIQTFTDKIINEEMSSRTTTSSSAAPDSRYIFLDSLLATTPDMRTVRSELLNILLAARDTTASLLSNILWELPRHPAVLARLRTEISSLTLVPEDATAPATATASATHPPIPPPPPPPPTYAQLKHLPYLRAILTETQRLHPTVPSNARQALVDTVLPRGAGPRGTAPVYVARGTYCAFHPYSMHRRTDVYGADAHAFRPERWLDPALRPGWAYVPFSGGPRVCIGQNFALTETMFVVVALVQAFELERVDFAEWREKLTITCTGLGGCRVRLRRRAG